MKRSKNRITAYNIASTAILQGLAFFSGSIFSAMLGPENYGISDVYQTWVHLASTVFSLQAGGTIALARVTFPMEDQYKYQSSVLSLSTLAYVVFSALTIIFVLVNSSILSVSFLMVVIGLIHGWGMYCVTFMNSKFTYEFSARRNLFLSVITAICTTGFSIICIYLFPAKHNYWGKIIGQASVYGIIGLLIFIYVIRSGKVLYNKKYWLFTLPVAIPTIFHLLANVVLNQSDKIMLVSLVNNSAAGLYALAATFGSVLRSIWAALNNSWVPYYYEYTRQNRIEEMKKHAKNYIELFTILSMVFILLSREVFRLYAHRSFWEITDLIPAFAIGHFFVFLYSFPVNYEFYNKKTKSIAIGTSAAAICNIGLNFIFIRIWGISGAVFTTVVSHGLQFGFHFISAKRIKPSEFPFRIQDFISPLLTVCATSSFCMLTREMKLLRWGVGTILSCYLLAKIVKRKEIF